MHSPSHIPLIPRHALSFVVLLFMVLSTLSPATAMIDRNVTFSLSPGDSEYNYPSPPTFSFSSSGNFFLSVTLDQPNPIPPTNYSIQVIFCSAAAINRLDLTSQLYANRLFCPDWDLTTAGAQCEWHALLGQNDQLPSTTPIRWTAATESSTTLPLTDDDYTLFIMNCGSWTDSNDFHYTGNDITGQFTFIAQSKPGEYLSLTYIPFKSLYIVAAVLWTIMLLVWSVHCWLWRAFNIRLQLALLVVPVSKMWLAVPYTAFYMIASSTGYANTNWYWVGRVSELLDEVIFFTVLILIAKGWRIIHAQLTRHWKKQYVMYILLLIGSSIAYQFGNRTIMITVLVIAYLLLFQYVFTSVMANTLTIVNAVQAFRAFPHIDLSTLPLWSKLHMYKLYQLALVLYASILLITQLWAGLFLTRLPWVSLAVEEVLSVLLGVALGYGLWMRPFNPYWYWITMLYAQRGEQGGDAGLATQNSNSSAARTHNEHDSSDRRERASRRSSSSNISAEHDDQQQDDPMRESAGRRALRQQNNDMRASLLHNDFLDSPARSPSPSHSDTSSTSSPPQLLWRPGMPVPPFPADPKQWLVTAEEEDAPLLVVRQPDGSIVLGQYASDVPCKVVIPDEALRYFPDELVDMLYNDDTADEEKDGYQPAEQQHDITHRRRRRHNTERTTHQHHTAATTSSSAEDDRMATSSPAVRRVSSPSQFSFSSSRHRASDHAPHSSMSDSRSESESSSWRGGGDDEDGVGSGAGGAGGADGMLLRGVSMQQLGDEEKKDGGGGGGGSDGSGQW